MKLNRHFEAKVIITGDKLDQLITALDLEKPNSKTELNVKEGKEKIVITHIDNTISFMTTWEYVTSGYDARFFSEQNKKMSYPIINYTTKIKKNHSDTILNEIEKKLPLDFTIENTEQSIKVQFSKILDGEIELKINVSGKRLLDGEVE